MMIYLLLVSTETNILFTIDETNVVRFWCRVRYMIETLLELVKGPKRDRSLKKCGIAHASRFD